MEMVYQLIGIVAMLFNFASFQQRKQQRLISIQFFSCVLFTLHFYLIGATMGCVMNAISGIRAFVFSRKERFRADKVVWVYVFVLAYLGAYALCFIGLGMEATANNLIIEFLPVIGMTLTTIGFYMKDARSVRIMSLLHVPVWLVYDILCQSIGGTLSELLCLTSIVIGILRLDVKCERNIVEE